MLGICPPRTAWLVIRRSGYRPYAIDQDNARLTIPVHGSFELRNKKRWSLTTRKQKRIIEDKKTYPHNGIVTNIRQHHHRQPAWAPNHLSDPTPGNHLCVPQTQTSLRQPPLQNLAL